MQNRKTGKAPDNEQIQLIVGQCNEMFIALRGPGHEQGGCEGGINGEKGGERGRDVGGRWFRRDEQLNLSNPFAGGD